MSLQDILPYRLPRIKGKRLLDPHIVIIGAGASIAACRTDKNGKQVPLLKNIHDVLGLTDLLKGYNFSVQEMQDFELLFSNIYEKPEFTELQHKLEFEICKYFKELTIPDKLTYYDYLILSLTNKDAIISFNWDPFLMQAYRRNIVIDNLPELIFPHGNAGVGICYNCKTIGYAKCLCPKCKNVFKDMPLLFPIKTKNYYNQSLIKNEWDRAKQKLSYAAGITVYGYGAPVSDIEAIELIKNAYSESKIKDIAPFTIINLLKVKKEQREKWSQFFDPKMFLYYESIEESILWKSPRVSLETLFDAILQGHPRDTEKSFVNFSNLQELQKFIKTINEYDMYI